MLLIIKSTQLLGMNVKQDYLLLTLRNKTENDISLYLYKTCIIIQAFLFFYYILTLYTSILKSYWLNQKMIKKRIWYLVIFLEICWAGNFLPPPCN